MDEQKIPQLTLTPDLDEPAAPQVKPETELKQSAPAPEAGPELANLSEAEQKAVAEAEADYMVVFLHTKKAKEPTGQAEVVVAM